MRIPLIDHKPREKPRDAHCHSGPQADTDGLPLVAIVGCPNVGKSVLFNALTGAYVTVSNFPGTTVEVSRGKGRFDGIEVGVVDTPGMYSLLPITEEERVGRRILLEEQPTVVVHVVDAKNLERMLPMTLQLIEAGLPVILDVNLMDEAERLGVQVDIQVLERELGVPVVATALTRSRGLQQLKETIRERIEYCPDGDAALLSTPVTIQYPPAIEDALHEIGSRLNGTYQITGRSAAMLLLQNDAQIVSQLQRANGTDAEQLIQVAETTRARFSRPISYLVVQKQREISQGILAQAVTFPEHRISGFAERLSEAMMNPWTGIPFLLLVLFLLYQFVGVLGAQTLVEFLEGTVFEGYINPWVDRLLVVIIPWPVIRELFGGEYGIITLGLRYAVALVLPIVGTFFIAFSIIEDSGYLPRLAMLIDRVFKRIGLNGRAVIPLVLGFGCDTMATIVTRTLETRRERVLSTLLLALAIPCSAQLGVMLGLLSGSPAALAIWATVIAGVFLLVGYLAARVLPGERPAFYMELPPLRLPTLGNVVVKTYTRMEWYLREVIPMFVLASVFIWLGRLTGLFDLIISALVPLMRWIGLPDEVAVAFLFGFFRRDYGAAGLYDLREAMNGVQMLVAMTTMTIFLPCVAQLSVMVKERGWKTALAITAFIFPFAFLVGGLLNALLTTLGVTL
jgi:ferrous iron transport protein B